MMRKLFFFSRISSASELKIGRGNDLQEKLTQRGCRLPVDRGVGSHDAAIRGNRVSEKSLAHRDGDTRSLRDPAWNRVLYNGRAYETSVVADETRTERRTGEKPKRRIQVEQIIIR